MMGLTVKRWEAAVNPAQHKAGRMVVLHGRDRFSAKFALELAGSWELDQLPERSKLRERQELGMRVSLLDVPIGRHLAVPVGKSQTTDQPHPLLDVPLWLQVHPAQGALDPERVGFQLHVAFQLLIVALVSGSSSTSTSTAVL